MATQSSVNWTPIIITLIAITALPKIIKGENGNEEEEEAKRKAEELLKKVVSENPLSGAAYKWVKKKKGEYRVTIDKKTLAKATKQIESGWGLNDSEAAIMGGIKRGRTQGDIAVISRSYNDRYSEDLNEKIRKNLSKKERRRIYAFVGSMPKYASTGTLR